MRHRKKVKKLGREREHRKATLRNIVRGVFMYGYSKTTTPRAKVARSIIDSILSRAMEDTVHNRRMVNRFLDDRKLTNWIFHAVAPLFRDSNHRGGYTRVLRIGYRRGDGAELSIIQLLRFPEESPWVRKKEGKKVEENA